MHGRGFTVAIVAATTLLYACGGSSGTPSSGAYLVGVPLPQTGSVAEGGTTLLNGEKVAAAEINAAGGVLGHQIQLVVQDDACDPQTGINAANKLVSQSVTAIVGHYCSSATLPTEPIYNRAGIPDISAAANASTLTKAGYKNVFLINPGGALQAQTAANFFVSAKAKKLMIVDDQSAYSVDVAGLTQQNLQKLGNGPTVLPLQAVPDTTIDFASVITLVRNSGCDYIYFTGYYAQAALFVRQLRGAGLTTTYVTADGGVDPAFIKDAGPAANGSYSTISVTTQFLQGSAAQKFTADYQKQFGSAPGPYSAYGYDAVYALAQAAKTAGSIEPAKVIAALPQVKVTGLTGDISFAPDHTRLGAKFVILQVVNGVYALAPNQP